MIPTLIFFLLLCAGIYIAGYNMKNSTWADKRKALKIFFIGLLTAVIAFGILLAYVAIF